jgi:hypothetical protein
MRTDPALSGEENFNVESSPAIGAIKPNAHFVTCRLGRESSGVGDAAVIENMFFENVQFGESPLYIERY